MRIAVVFLSAMLLGGCFEGGDLSNDTHMIPASDNLGLVPATEMTPAPGSTRPALKDGIIQIVADTRINGYQLSLAIGWLEAHGVDCLDFTFEEAGGSPTWGDIRIWLEDDLPYAGWATWVENTLQGDIQIHPDYNYDYVLGHELAHILLSEKMHDEDRWSFFYWQANPDVSWALSPDTEARLPDICRGGA